MSMMLSLRTLPRLPTMRQRLPATLAFLLFLAVCASLTYWLLQWLAPAPRQVAAPPQQEVAPASMMSAAQLFGARTQGQPLSQVQLRGLIRAGRNSMAIIATEGAPPRAVAMHAEILPGVTLSEVRARTVIVNDHGAEHELTLPAFAAQEGNSVGPQVSAPATAPPPAAAGNPQTAQTAAPPASGASATPSSASSGVAQPGAPAAPPPAPPAAAPRSAPTTRTMAPPVPAPSAPPSR